VVNVGLSGRATLPRHGARRKCRGATPHNATPLRRRDV